MTTEQKKAVRHNAWKFLGSMFMDKKDGHWAMSLTRVLTLLVTIQAMCIWSGFTEQQDLPDKMFWVLLTLLGVKTGNGIVDMLKG
jgi:hypothetical protein